LAVLTKTAGFANIAKYIVTIIFSIRGKSLYGLFLPLPPILSRPISWL